jgi:hypothetical protein
VNGENCTISIKAEVLPELKLIGPKYKKSGENVTIIVFIVVCVYRKCFPTPRGKHMKSSDNIENIDPNEMKQGLRFIILTLEPVAMWQLNNRISG